MTHPWVRRFGVVVVAVAKAMSSMGSASAGRPVRSRTVVVAARQIGPGGQSPGCEGTPDAGDRVKVWACEAVRHAISFPGWPPVRGRRGGRTRQQPLMRKLAVVIVLALVAACGGQGGESRTVLIDFAHDQFASMFLRFFPGTLQAHPGDRIVFRQAWTGEAHTVTGGRLADEVGRRVSPYLGKGRLILPFGAPPPVQEALDAIGSPFDETGHVTQAIAQPCYLRSGRPPSDGAACAQRDQPVFDGRASLFSSGFIPYEGPAGNRYTVRLSSDIEPGRYFFFCVTHGPSQSTFVEVRPKGDRIPSVERQAAQARREMQLLASKEIDFRRGAIRRNEVEIAGATVKGPFAGLWTPGIEEAFVNEFVPKELTVKTGEPVTWSVLGSPHTISFDVPRYFPIVSFEEDGKVVRNPKVDEPAGGAPELPAFRGPPPDVLRLDGGTYDGRGFWSSGSLIAPKYVTYTLRFSRPGTYRYACLIHPPMVGTVTVTA